MMSNIKVTDATVDNKAIEVSVDGYPVAHIEVLPDGTVEIYVPENWSNENPDEHLAEYHLACQVIRPGLEVTQ